MADERIDFVRSLLASRLINRFTSAGQQHFSKILLIRLDEIGDMITTLPALDVLRSSHPDATITLWCKPPSNQLFLHDPRIDTVVTLQEELTGSYDLIVEFRGNAATRRYALQHRPLIRLDRGSVRLRQTLIHRGHPHEVVTNLQVVSPVVWSISDEPQLRLFITDAERDNARQFLHSNSIGTFVVFHIGAMKELKRWPLQRFAELAARLHDMHGWDIVFVGGKEDAPKIAETQALIHFPTYSFAGQGSLLDYAALAGLAVAMIGNDSGPMHIASAMGVPVVGLFGPGEPNLFRPMGKRSTFVHHKLECNPCDQIHCVHPELPCMHRITVDEVHAALQQVIAG